MKTEELLKGIKYVMPGVDQSQLSSEGADLVTFDDRWIRTYDGNLSVSYPLGTGLNCSVPGKPLFDLLNKLGEGNVRLVLEGDQFQMKGPNKKLKLQVVGRELDEEIFGLDKVIFNPLPEGFFDALGLCVFSASKDPTMGVLQGIFIDDRIILATDNFRISHFELAEGIKGKLVLPLNCVNYVMRMEGVNEIGVDLPGWVHFRNEQGVILSGRLFSEEYKSEALLNILGTEVSGEYDFPKGTEEAVTRASVLSDREKDDVFVKVKREGDKLVVVGETKGLGEYEEKVDWKDSFPEGNELRINPDFLLKILKVTKRFSTSKDGRFVIFSGKDGKFKHLEIVKVSE